MNARVFRPNAHNYANGTPHSKFPDLIYMDMEIVGVNAAFSGYVPRDIPSLLEAAPDLLAIAREYASQCVNCNGSAEIIKNDRGGDAIDDRAEPCPACKDIWGVIDRATKP